jgi:hypothetical protein
MPGIVITAIGVAIAATLLYGGVLVWRAPREERPLLVLCYLLQLPMSAATFYLVRVPLDQQLVHPWLGDSAIYWWGRVLYAPLTEEPAKLWPLLIPWIASRVTRDNATRVAMALGLGFGVGEVGFIANVVLGDAQMAAAPWYQFTGFISERLLVCLIHGLFTAMTLLGWKRWRIGFVGGLALGMLLHFLGNAPILVAAAGLLGSNQMVVATILQLWVVGFWVAAMILLLVSDPRIAGIPLPGKPVTCPKCGAPHQRQLLALKFGWKRYERCPSCGKWSFV